MSKNRLYLIDATAFCYRAFYALSGLTTSFGQPTNAVYGFTVILNKIIKEHKPEFLAICLDVSRDTFRQKKFADYKIQRPPMPEGLANQIPLIKEIISAYGIAIFEKEGFEADDIIATLTKKAHQKSLEVTIVSFDKDILQLVDDHTSVFSPYKDEGIIYDTKKVYQRFGIKPPQIPDIIALMGDSVDNIPSIPGIGEKTAVELINNFGSLKNLLENTGKIKQEKLKKTITENIEKIKLNSELSILCDSMDIDCDLEKMKLGQPNSKELYRLFRHLEFKKLLKDLPSDDSQEEIKPFGLQDDELIIYAENPEDIVIHTKGEMLSLNGNVAGVNLTLSDAKIKKIGHDLKKIKVPLAKKGFSLDGLYFDTMIAAYLLNPSKTDYGLSDVAWDYLQKFPSSGSLSAQKAVSLIGQLKPILEEQLKVKSLMSLFLDIEMPLIEVLARMELNGIKLDLKLLSNLSKDLEKRLIKLIEDIYALSGCQFNINSPKQLRDVLFEKLKLPVIKKSKTGPSTDEEVLRNLARSHKLPALLLEYRQLMKLKSTYVDTLPELVDEKTGRVHTSFNQTATETGRLSSSNPNLQNIPIKTDIGRKIRQAIIAATRDDYLLSCDYSQIELRLLAHICQDENLISAFKEDKDIHKATAALIYGLDNENDVTDEMREVAKRVNFGIIYGLTSYGLSRDLDITQDEAQAFIDAYFLRYPKVKEYMQEQIKKAEKDGFVTTILGRRRYIPEINNKNQAIRQFAQRKAINTPIQGSASDLIKLAMIQIYRQIKQNSLEARMILQIHDELVFEVSGSEIDDFSALVKDKMENVLKLNVPIKVKIMKGRNWLEMEPACRQAGR
jgi:DNA polymerase-1